MANAVLVDSNIYIDILRQGEDPAEIFDSFGEEIDWVTCGMVRLEVLRGIRSPQHRDLLASMLDVQINVPTDNRLWEEAMQLAWQMDRTGRMIPAQDILIACCARRSRACVLTRDGHFTHIPDLKVLFSFDEI